MNHIPISMKLHTHTTIQTLQKKCSHQKCRIIFNCNHPITASTLFIHVSMVFEETVPCTVNCCRVQGKISVLKTKLTKMTEVVGLTKLIFQYICQEWEQENWEFYYCCRCLNLIICICLILIFNGGQLIWKSQVLDT